MKSVIQCYRTGELEVFETPPPQIRPGCALVRTAYSLISAGTEKTKVDTAKKLLLGKAMARPDLVKKVIAKARKDGLWKTWETVSHQLNTPVAMGYSCAGEVIEVQGDVDDLRPGDLVACAGSTANHAEIVSVPKNLLVRVPDGVRLEHAAFTTLGAIAMQGVRQADARVGERIAVIGLGLVGLLTVQIARASGCRVFGIDIDPNKLELGKALGCEFAVLASDQALMEEVLLFTDGYGVDATIITAATASNIPIEQAAEITREKGRVIAVGLTKMEIPREPFYMKELDLRLSRSYGPGRYHKDYEEYGHDYPYAYVRFTEQRNMSCFLELVQNKQIQLDPMITHRFPIGAANEAYELFGTERKEPYLGILLEYGRKIQEMPRRIELRSKPLKAAKIVVGVIGAGKYAATHLLPLIQAHPEFSLGTVCTASGFTAVHVGEKLGFAAADSDIDAVIAASDAVLIATRHNEHADLAIKALRQGKPVFVEKPLAITEKQLEQVIACLQSRAPSPRRGEAPPLAPSAGERVSEGRVRGTTTRSQPSSPPFPLRSGERAGVRCSENSQPITNQESGIRNQESGIRNHKSRITSHESPSLTVGFNRRFAPATAMVKKHFESLKEPKQVCIRVNAGAIPSDHWIHDPHVGGGRLIGEGCHFVDLAVALIGAAVTTVSAVAIPQPGRSAALWDNFIMTMEMEDDSIATVIYSSIGDAGLSKERIEVHGGGRSAIIDDFQSVELWTNGKKKRKTWFRQDKGQRGQIDAWTKALREGSSSIPFAEIVNVHQACFAAVEAIRDGRSVNIAVAVGVSPAVEGGILPPGSGKPS